MPGPSASPLASHKLLSILGPAFGNAKSGPEVTATLSTLPGGATTSASGLADLLARRNGAYGFEGALMLLAVGGPPGLDLAAWNRAPGWRAAYGGLADDLLIFAFDGFGGAFALSGDEVVAFDPETAEREPLGADIEAWARALLDDYRVLTGHPLVAAWQRGNRALAANERLEPLKPFVLGGAFAVENLVAADLETSLRRRGRLAMAIRDAPDGARLSWPMPAEGPPKPTP